MSANGKDQRSQSARGSSSAVTTPPRITISWATELNENRVIFFCRNNSRIASNPVYLSLGAGDRNHEEADGAEQDPNAIQSSGGRGESGELEYSCENNNLCLLNVKKSYPLTYKCFVKSYILPVKLNVIGKFLNCIRIKFKFQLLTFVNLQIQIRNQFIL